VGERVAELSGDLLESSAHEFTGASLDGETLAI